MNKVFLIGFLGRDPELRMTQSQTAICNFSMATTEKRKGAQGQYENQTEWHNVVVIGKFAETCSRYLKKGSKACVEGRLQTRKWKSKEGVDRQSTEIMALNVEFLSEKKEADPNQQPVSNESANYSTEDIPF